MTTKKKSQPCNLEPIYRATGVKIARVRTSRKLSQSEAAALIKITRSQMSNIEQGNSRVQLHTLAALAIAFKVRLADLLGAK